MKNKKLLLENRSNQLSRTSKLLTIATALGTSLGVNVDTLFADDTAYTDPAVPRECIQQKKINRPFIDTSYVRKTSVVNLSHIAISVTTEYLNERGEELNGGEILRSQPKVIRSGETAIFEVSTPSRVVVSIIAADDPCEEFNLRDISITGQIEDDTGHLMAFIGESQSLLQHKVIPARDQLKW